MSSSPRLSRQTIAADEWVAHARQLGAGEGTLTGLWAEADSVQMAILDDASGAIAISTLPCPIGQFPSVARHHPAAMRLERSIADLFGLSPDDAPDARPWLDHGKWGVRHPLANTPTTEFDTAPYSFLPSQGEGLHQIPVGPVHAGIIEPGHFRFQVVGEKVLRLEERLSYVHKGIEKRFEALSIADGSRLAARISGDSAVAYGWAYAQAAEEIAGLELSPRATWLRALCLERERLANHLGDLGYLGNDGGFAFGLSQFSRLKEDLLRLNRRVFGHRLLMDVIVPGGVTHDIAPESAAEMRGQCTVLGREIRLLRDIYDDHAGLQDRFRNCGRVSNELATKLGLCGFAARASGVPDDLRCDFPLAPYDALAVRRAGNRDGDVAARVAVRFDEALESLRLIDVILDALPQGDIITALPRFREFKPALGCVEGWRGPVWLALESGPADTIRRCHPHDPSWQNWPVIEHAVIGNIVPDFPLINKSFNLSYSGHDL